MKKLFLLLLLLLLPACAGFLPILCVFLFGIFYALRASVGFLLTGFFCFLFRDFRFITAAVVALVSGVVHGSVKCVKVKCFVFHVKFSFRLW